MLRLRVEGLGLRGETAGFVNVKENTYGFPTCTIRV